MFGVYYSPSEFVEAALRVQHPSSLEVFVPAELRETVHRNLHTSPAVLAKERTETIRKWIAWGNELQDEEDELKAAMSPHRLRILAGKGLKLFEKVLASSGHQDSNLVRDSSQGFSLTGRLPRSEVFKDCFRPASQTVEMFRKLTNSQRIWEGVVEGPLSRACVLLMITKHPKSMLV